MTLANSMGRFLCVCCASGHGLQGQSATTAYDTVTFLSRESSRVSIFIFNLFQFYSLFGFYTDIVDARRKKKNWTPCGNTNTPGKKVKVICHMLVRLWLLLEHSQSLKIIQYLIETWNHVTACTSNYYPYECAFRVFSLLFSFSFSSSPFFVLQP